MDPTLEGLPTEILIAIALSLDGSGQRLNLLYTSRRFYNALLPTLYDVINRTRGYVVPWKLLRTILQKPWLAQMVHELSLPTTYQFYFPIDEDPSFEPWITSEAAVPTLRKAVESIFNGDEQETEHWLEKLRDGSPEVLNGLLMLSLPRLERLELEMPGYEFLGRAIRQVYPPTACGNSITSKRNYDNNNHDIITTPTIHLSRLTHLHLFFPGSHQVFLDPALAIPLFQLPSVRQFSGARFCLPSYDWTYDIMPSITHMRFMYCSFGNGAKPMIENCKELQSFTYLHTENDEYEDDSGTLFNPLPEILRESLLPSRHSLETLCLDFSTDTETNMLFRAVGSLSEFTALNHLHISAEILLPLYYDPERHGRVNLSLPKILPRSLETLHVEGLKSEKADHVLGQLSSFVKSAQRYTPNLRQVCVMMVKMVLNDATRESFENVDTESKIVCEFKGWVPILHDLARSEDK
ncbi:hypothetical protein AJ79_00897 [Helicocarpus griseus UAMH5409]|uniref:Leucine-rich repeat domain-containing protein n=1 Tax=Helicocarpus griseus UAMH5409 TaxID=1447875 RepID=A0A2B7Y8B9_9EURO|nr:hypothetical protein AJ79_00897 [Helicocarpus griseus UAMH5409]